MQVGDATYDTLGDIALAEHTSRSRVVATAVWWYRESVDRRLQMPSPVFLDASDRVGARGPERRDDVGATFQLDQDASDWLLGFAGDIEASVSCAVRDAIGRYLAWRILHPEVAAAGGERPTLARSSVLDTGPHRL